MPLNINFQQIFLHLLNFTILVAALYFLLYGPVKKFMDKRAAYYDGLDRQAEEKLAEADKVKADYDSRLARAGEEAQQLKAQAQQEAADEAQSQIELAKTEAAHIIAQAKAEAQAEREHIMNEARKEVAELVTDAAGKILLHSTSDAYDQFLSSTKGRGKDA